jgi:chromosome segregation ATPase
MAAHLQQIETRQTRISELVDQLAAERASVEAEVNAAAEFAEQTGQTAETRQALDASTAVVAQLGEQVGGVSDSATEAADQLSAARQGLRVVEEAEDALTSAGADGRAVAPAGAGA